MRTTIIWFRILGHTNQSFVRYLQSFTATTSYSEATAWIVSGIIFFIVTGDIGTASAVHRWGRQIWTSAEKLCEMTIFWRQWMNYSYHLLLPSIYDHNNLCTVLCGGRSLPRSTVRKGTTVSLGSIYIWSVDALQLQVPHPHLQQLKSFWTDSIISHPYIQFNMRSFSKILAVASLAAIANSAVLKRQVISQFPIFWISIQQGMVLCTGFMLQIELFGTLHLEIFTPFETATQNINMLHFRCFEHSESWFLPWKNSN